MTDKEINTEGGAIVDKDVATNGGDFIGRDSVHTNTNILDGNVIVAVIAVLVIGIISVIIIAKDKIIFERPLNLPTSTDNGTSIPVTVPTTNITLPVSNLSSLFQAYDVGEDFKQNCINTGHWEPYAYFSTVQTIGQEISAFIDAPFKLGCMELDAQKAWGFYATNGSLTISQRQKQDTTIYGLSTSLPESSIIKFNLLIQNSSKGEIYFGILSKPRADPLSAGETYISVQPDNVIQLVTSALGTLEKYPFATNRVYSFRFEVTLDEFKVNINNGEKIFKTIGDFGSRYFMIGYRLETGKMIDATISDLSISAITPITSSIVAHQANFLSILDSYVISKTTSRTISGTTNRKPISCLSRIRIGNITGIPTMITSFDMVMKYEGNTFSINNISWHPYANSIGIRNNLSFDPATVSTALYSDELYRSGQYMTPGTITDFPYKIDKASTVDFYATIDFSYDTLMNLVSDESKEGFLPLEVKYSFKTAHNQIIETGYNTCIYIK